MADIELIIKIPEEMYQKIKETNMVIGGRRSGERFDYILFNAVNTGTPLPKGHGRLIDADAVLVEPFGNTYKDIDIAETIIEADKEQTE